jgi:hypothetical protein
LLVWCLLGCCYEQWAASGSPCHDLLTLVVVESARRLIACDATVVRLGDHARARFRTRHNPCGAVVDVSLPMLRRGGWTCQMCKWTGLGPRNRALGAVTQQWSVARQEQLLLAANMRSLLPLGDADGDEPINSECLECGGAAADSRP